MTAPGNEIVTRLEEITPEARLELWRWLEPFLKQKTGGGIKEITSDDGSVTVTDPTGPVTDLSSSGIRFNTEPQLGGWLDVETNMTDANGNGIHFNANLNNIVLDGGGGFGQVLVSPNVLLTGNTATFQVGTGAGGFAAADIVSDSKNFRVKLGTGGDGFAVFHGATATKIFQAQNGGGADAVGFFNVGPALQQAAPSSAQDIANALAAYGLLASAGTVDSSTVDGGSA